MPRDRRRGKAAALRPQARGNLDGGASDARAMTQRREKNGRNEAAPRQERLAAALRANLKRRKEQARARDAEAQTPPAPAPPEPLAPSEPAKP